MKAIKGVTGTIRIEDIPVARYARNTMKHPAVYENHVPTLTAPVNQGLCGSCWAISTTQSLRDRLNRGRKQMLVPELSFQFVIDCAKNCVTFEGREGCSLDCNGGFLSTSFEFLTRVGTVRDAYHPNRHDDESGIDHIDGTSGTALACPATIPENETLYKCIGYKNIHLYQDMFGITNARVRPRQRPLLELQANADNIAEEIYLHGPVAVCFNLFSDFRDFWMHPNSKNMVYQIGWKLSKAIRNTVDPVGDIRWGSQLPPKYGITFKTGHSVSIVGYGSQTNVDGEVVDYWICRNSWGFTPNALYNGFFKIRRGINASAIEADVCACYVADPPPEAMQEPTVPVAAAEKPVSASPALENPVLSAAGAPNTMLDNMDSTQWNIRHNWFLPMVFMILLIIVVIYMLSKPSNTMFPLKFYAGKRLFI